MINCFTVYSHERLKYNFSRQYQYMFKQAGEENKKENHQPGIYQGSYGSWKTWNVLEFYSGVFQDWEVLEKGDWSWKVPEIC